MSRRSPAAALPWRVLLATLPAFMLLLPVTSASAQQPPDSATVAHMTAQYVDSPKGYVVRVPQDAVLDSSRSGWNPEERFERRVFRLSDGGEIRLTVTVAAQSIPDSATRTSAYTWVDDRIATDNGYIYARTWFLPTRRVTMEFVPLKGGSVARYVAVREQIFETFRWKPGATSSRIDVDRHQHVDPADYGFPQR